MSSADSDTDSPSSDEKHEAEEEDEVTVQKRKKIREELSTMSFEDLQKLKDEMGSKLYNQTVFGVEKNKTKTSFKRANKNRPREISSKKQIRLENNVIQIKKHRSRDPRFDPLCGQFDRKVFKNNYKFVNDLRKKEKTQLEKELKETTDSDKKKKIKYVVQRLDNQIREQEKQDKIDQQDYEEKEEIKNKLKQGEKVQFKKKSVKRLENLIGKYEELKKTNKLQKHIEKRSKKLSARERRRLERQKLVTFVGVMGDRVLRIAAVKNAQLFYRHRFESAARVSNGVLIKRFLFKHCEIVYPRGAAVGSGAGRGVDAARVCARGGSGAAKIRVEKCGLVCE
ncbi:DUF947 domain containing protein [Asbolus verrucosus]|uniref:rRNA biogenesis protein RRP36 n=1 Tax=Asbolus verrucosus TaxID=1661398 RepID=A0A482VAN4_ASBVE|nr:DUF947 domain containing protein [Asbolus verrucosus]